MPALYPMAADGIYPNAIGVRFGLISQLNPNLYPTYIIDVELLVAGTPGTGASYQVQTMDRNGNWYNAKLIPALTGPGVVAGTVEGAAVRVNAANGTTPGTGVNTPCYHLSTFVKDETAYTPLKSPLL